MLLSPHDVCAWPVFLECFQELGLGPTSSGFHRLLGERPLKLGGWMDHGEFTFNYKYANSFT